MGQPSVGVGQRVFAPEPLLIPIAQELLVKSMGKDRAHAAYRRISAVDLHIGMQADEREGPGARRGEALDDLESVHEKSCGHVANSIIRSESDRLAEAPKSAGM